MTLCCICKKKNNAQDDDFIDNETISRLGGFNLPNNTNEINPDIDDKKFTFRSSSGITREIFINKNFTIKDLIKKFFIVINQIELYKESAINFLCDGALLKKKSDEKISKFCEKHNENPQIVVIDINSKINNQ